LIAEKQIHIKEHLVGTTAHKHLALLTDYDITSQYTIAYQNLFANIRFDWDQDKSKRHTITLVTPTEYRGRATATTNIAIAAAQNGVPTVLVDTDLHTPSIHKHFSTQNQRGLSDLLHTNEITPQFLAQSLSKTFIPDLSLLVAGSASYQPVEISRLLSTKLPNVIDGLRQYLDTNESRPSLIILNSPPMSHGIDAALISSIVDQTFLLIIRGHTRRPLLLKAQQQLERAHAKLTGIIMLDV
jgi:capsular exopolysaccharide synthesis family protein